MNTQKLIESAFAVFGVNNFFDLRRAYTEEDQRLMKSEKWDAFDPQQKTNQLKLILEKISINGVSGDDCVWLNEIIWFWYHHAISFAIRINNRVLAQAYAEKALQHQDRDEPTNRITRLLWFLVRDRVSDAVAWIETDPQHSDYQTGMSLLDEYRAHGGFFPNELDAGHPDKSVALGYCARCNWIGSVVFIKADEERHGAYTELEVAHAVLCAGKTLFVER